VHPRSTFSDCCQLATPLNAEVQKTAKLFFFANRGDRINRSRRNSASKHIPWVCYRVPNLALIGKRGRYRSPQKSKCAHNCGFWPPEADTINTFRSKLACKCIPWVCCSTPNLTLIGERGSILEPQKVKICLKLWFLATESQHNEQIHSKFAA